ncbi:MAG TPA: RNA 2'-phosphotransferase [Acidobacteria bacterium]|nr:RNA 2'-phosphotransferase [Acidobacteriota bacterium]
MAGDLVRLSKFLSLVLRHEPQRIGLSLDPQGWVAVDELLAAAAQAGTPLTREELERVVVTNDKKRFAFSPDGSRIRASQGHSVEVELGLPPTVPPERLFHGTATRFVDSIRAEGLRAQSRQHVHLSPDEETAVKVGQRHGKPVVLAVRAAAMHGARHAFYLSDNGVWLTAAVPPGYLEFPG